MIPSLTHKGNEQVLLYVNLLLLEVGKSLVYLVPVHPSSLPTVILQIGSTRYVPSPYLEIKWLRSIEKLKLNDDGFKVEWRKGSPFSPETYTELLPSCTAVVSTLGILFESDYKSKERQVNPMKVLKNMANSLLGDTKGNPLKSGSSSSSNGMTYERMNRDAGMVSFQHSRFRSLDRKLTQMNPPCVPYTNTQLSLVSELSPLPLLNQPLSHHLYIYQPKISFDLLFHQGISKLNEKLNGLYSQRLSHTRVIRWHVKFDRFLFDPVRLSFLFSNSM